MKDDEEFEDEDFWDVAEGYEAYAEENVGDVGDGYEVSFTLEEEEEGSAEGDECVRGPEGVSYNFDVGDVGEDAAVPRRTRLELRTLWG